MRLLLLLLPLGLFAEDAKYEANLNCEIVGIEISKISEGKYESYDGYESGLEVGDKFSFFAEYRKIELFEKVTGSLILDSGKIDIAEAQEIYLPPIQITTNDYKEVFKYFSSYDTWSGVTTLNSDYKFTNIAGSRYFSFERYYKDDYQLEYSAIGLSGYRNTYYFNCMNNRNFTKAIDKFFKTLEDKD